MENKKRIEYYINRLQNLNDKGDDIKMVIEDSFETQEKEYEKNQDLTQNKHSKDMSLVPLYIVLVLFFNLIIYNIYSDDKAFIPFITFFISLYLLYKYVPLKAKQKFVSDFEKNIKKVKEFFSKENKNSELKKYIAISSEDDHNELLKEEEENNDNYIISPLLNI